MTELLHSWVSGLTAASCLAAFSKELTPKGPVRKVTRFVCGVMLALVLVEPLAAVDEESFSLSLAEYRKTVREITADAGEREKDLLRLYIEEQTAAYIVDEAQGMGIPELSAEVKAKWGDESWLPWEVHIRTEAAEEQRAKLSRRISAELAIPPERQFWNEDKP